MGFFLSVLLICSIIYSGARIAVGPAKVAVGGARIAVGNERCSVGSCKLQNLQLTTVKMTVGETSPPRPPSLKAIDQNLSALKGFVR